MRELIVAEFITLDGVIQAPGGADEDTEGGFKHGGWTWPYWHDDIGAHFSEAMAGADALLLGRKTWQIHGGAFEPMEGDEFADAMNAMPKYVASTTLDSAAAWRNSTLIRENVVEEVRRLKEQPGKNILLDGSSVLVQALHDLVDEVQPARLSHRAGGRQAPVPAGQTPRPNAGGGIAPADGGGFHALPAGSVAKMHWSAL
jgi:dihydrofolate reductase